MSLEIAAISSVLGILVPLAILFGRFAVRRQRQATLRHLRDTLKHTTGRDASLFPSFEFALQKYGLDPGSADRRPILELVFFGSTAAIFMLLSAAGCSMLLGHAGVGVPNEYRMILGGYQALPLTEPALTNYETLTADVVAIAFLGAYLWSIQYLIRRISVYDLSATSFLRVTGQIILAASTAAIIRHLVGDSAGSEGWTVNVLLAASFLIGFFPSAGLDLLIRRVPQLRIKNLDPDAAKAYRIMPVEMIDGIDSQVSFRLAERDIGDVENLATENPILLCAETPYSFFQVIDWIAQAQLAVEVGPRKFKGLRDIGCRTILSLEAAVGDKDREPSLLAILSEGMSEPPKTLAAHVNGMKANVHVERLCLIHEVLNEAMRDGAVAMDVEGGEDLARGADLSVISMQRG